MKKTLFAFLLAGGLFAQTKTNLVDIKPPVAPPAPVYLFGMFPGVGLLALDPAGFVLDKSTTPPTIRAVVSSGPGPSLTDVDDIFTAAAGQIGFVTSAVPKGSVRVFRNGVLQRVITPTQTGDYTISVDAVTKIVTISANEVLQGDYITICYQK